jgi:transcriptional regulator with XRE-family HTH domain
VRQTPQPGVAHLFQNIVLRLRANSAGRRRTVAVTEGQPLGVLVCPEGEPWSSFQWQIGRRGGVFANMPEASGASYEIPAAPLGWDGALLRCVGLRPERVKHSEELRLRVLPASHPLRRVYTLEALPAAKHAIDDFHQLEFFLLWNLLPASTRRALFRDSEDAAVRARKATLLSAVEDLLSPALGRPMNPLLGDYRAEDLGGVPLMAFLLESVGFLRTPAALESCLAKSAEEKIPSLDTPAALRAAMAAGNCVAESAWAILDTAEWAPRTFARVVGDAGDAVRDRLLAQCREWACPALDHCVTAALASRTSTLIDLALKAPAVQRASAPAVEDDRDVWAAVHELAAVNPRRYWSAREVREYMGQNGKSAPPLPAVLARLDDLTGDGPCECRRRGADFEYRVRVAGNRNRRLNPAAIVWHGLHRSQIPRAAEFRRQGDRHLLSDQWKAQWRLRLAEEAKSAGANQDDIYADVVNQLITAYELLRVSGSPVTAGQVFEAMQQRFPGELLVDDPEAMERALRWLAVKGFAMVQDGEGWTVRGLARRWFLDVYIAGWPAPERLEWERLRDASPEACDPLHRDDPAHMQRRAELILSVNEVLLEESDAGAGENWDLSCHKPNGPFLDAALYHWGRRLGVEPVLLRTGSSRVQLEPHILSYIHDLSVIGEMSIARRLTMLRRLAGPSRAALAEAVGVSHETIVNLETGAVDEFHDPRKWRRLAQVLSVDPFVVLTGMDRAHAVASRKTFEARLKLFCQAEGLLGISLQREMKCWSAQASKARRGLATDPAFCRALLNRFAITTPSHVELFGCEQEAAEVRLSNGKPRSSAGKFEAKADGTPEMVLSNILRGDELQDRARRQQGYFTLRDYIDVCAKRTEVSEGTFRRTFAKLVASGELQAGKPEGLHGSMGYRVTCERATAAGTAPM